MDEGGKAATVVYGRSGRVATIELNRPERRNALSAELLVDLDAAIDQLEADPGASVCVVRGRGPSFCAGFDLGAGSASAASSRSDPWADRARLRAWIATALRLLETPTPVIAEIHGHCLAGGSLFLICADLVCVADDCVIGWAKLPMGAGFMDGALAQLIGVRRAKQLSFAVGSEISGREACEWGLANFTFPADRLRAATEAYAESLARAPRDVLQIRKAAINRAVGGGLRDAALAGAEWDAIAHVTPAVDEVRGLVREHGMKAVIASFQEDEPPFAELRDGAGPADPTSVQPSN
ncbi:MAG: enoyl-CoA hydratase-related protein [Solirubrobacterales bacterium]